MRKKISEIINSLFSWYFSRNALPYWVVLLMDSFIIIMSELVSVYLCRGGSYFTGNFWSYLTMFVCTLPLYWIGMRIFHTYSGIFRYSSFNDLVRVGGAILFGIILEYTICEAIETRSSALDLMSLRLAGFTYLIATLLMWSERIVVKNLYDITSIGGKARSVLIYGIKEGGVALAKSMRNEHPTKYIVKGFVTPSESMAGRFLLGCHVYRSDEDLNDIIRQNHIKYIFVSPLFAEDFRNNQSLVSTLTRNRVRIMMMHDAETWDGHSDLSHQNLHEVEIEDLLPRDPINVDLDAIGQLLHGKRILITGAAGSIGFEMVHQVAQYSPEELILVDQAETPMHDVRLFMSRNYPDMTAPTIVGSITNQTQMEAIFRHHRPEYVFHAAAYKHVPMMEDNPAMAVQNNIYGTHIIADLAVKYGTRKFVMISTDKAVNPTNVMGCSKRICEIYCQSLNKAIHDGTCPIKVVSDTPEVTKPITQFVTTRFGNVLGSNGSVIPIFKEQIRKGGPVTVTHPDIIRFFMLIPEACQLVLEAGTMGHGGEIFVFDMGKPVRIADLAQRMIDLSRAKNIEIRFTGLRDGEKLYEEVLNDAEGNQPTVHPKIKVAKVREYPYDEVLRNEKELYDLSFTYDDMAIVKKMKDIVPEYKSRVSKYEVLDNN